MNLICKIKGHSYELNPLADGRIALMCSRCLDTELRTLEELEIETLKKRKSNKPIVFMEEPTADEEWLRDHPLQKLFKKIWRK